MNDVPKSNISDKTSHMKRLTVVKTIIMFDGRCTHRRNGNVNKVSYFIEQKQIYNSSTFLI